MNDPISVFDQLVSTVDPEHWKALQVFTPPRSLKKWKDAANSNQRFVHYTSAEAAMKIISQREIWMRSTLVMNDYSEVRYGVERVAAFMTSEEARPCWEIFEKSKAGSADEFKKSYDAWVHDLETNTYVTCLSEHDSTEDEIGRLSMWRNYAGGTGVAMVINGHVMMRFSDALNAYTHPVLYLTDDELLSEFSATLKNIVENADFVAAMTHEHRTSYLFGLLHSFAYSLKHPGFHEEREWRVVYRPNFEKSKYITSDVSSVGGVPQMIYRIPLRDLPEENFFGLNPDALLDRLIIGPTEHPLAMGDAFAELLRRADVQNPRLKIRFSNMPVRIPR